VAIVTSDAGATMEGVDAGGGTAPRVALALIRLLNGVLGLVVPHLLIKRIDPAEPPSPAAIYAFRLFGIRTILVAIDLLRGPGAARAKAVEEAPLMHASDTTTATLLTLTGRVPLKSGAPLVAISALNTVLAFAARRAAHR
jgi:hypothetical protein